MTATATMTESRERSNSTASNDMDRGCGRADYLSRLGIQKPGSRNSFSSVPRKISPPVSGEADVAPSTPPVQTFEMIEGDAGDDNANSAEKTQCLDLKEKDDFRISFLRRLSYENVWVPAAQRMPKSQTLIIFDWDDTLLCTTYLNRVEACGRPMPPAAQAHLRGIEKIAIHLLEESMKLGQTWIITNASQGWIEYSAAKWVPAMLPVLERVQIISARSKYEAMYPQEVAMWKLHAFRDLQRELDLPVITNLNSIGDSEYEMDATKVMGAAFAEAAVKTIKLRPNPTPEELLKELQLVSEKFEKIVTNARTLKIALERRPAGAASPPNGGSA